MRYLPDTDSFSGNLCIYKAFVSLRPGWVFTWRLEKHMNSITRYASLSASSGISLITCFLISARETPTRVGSKWDIKQTVLKHKIKTIFLLYYILYFLAKVSMTHLHAKCTFFYHNDTEWVCGEILFIVVPYRINMLQKTEMVVTFTSIDLRISQYFTCIALSAKTSLLLEFLLKNQ